MSKIAAPIFFLWGEDDPFGLPEVARTFVERVPNAELELLPNAGHAVWLDDPEHAANITTDFLVT